MQTITVDLNKPLKVVVMDGDQIAFTTIVHTPHFRVKKKKSTLRFDVVTVDIDSQHVPFTKGQ